MTAGYLALVLHAHMPFVRHPQHEDFLEEGWLHEAILESYIPLLWMLEGLANEGVDYRITISLSPTLVAMLGDPLLRERCALHLERLSELAEREVLRTRHMPDFAPTARFYLQRIERARRDYEERWKRNLILPFARLAAAGNVELITCAATHGYLPLLAETPEVVRAQLEVGISHHLRAIGSAPRGLWLPECGFYPGLDELLSQAQINYTFLETHAVDYATSAPTAGVYAPLRSPSGLTVFGRDPESTRQVWSAETGYPGDPDYREYYRDVGFDLELAALGACAHPLGIRRNVGIKYFRVTGRTEHKEPYVRERALERAAAHAAHFSAARRRQVAELGSRLNRPPIVTAPYDAELFGHWWFEGPDWLGAVLREIARDPASLNLITPSEYMAQFPENQCAMPAASSWGHKGHSEMWLNERNDWVYPHLHAAGERMVAAARHHARARASTCRALNQAARELLLAQASDWAFMMSQGTTVAYATARTGQHLAAFRRLLDMVDSGQVDAAYLASLEAQDNLFPELDFRCYQGAPGVPVRG